MHRVHIFLVWLDIKSPRSHNPLKICDEVLVPYLVALCVYVVVSPHYLYEHKHIFSINISYFIYIFFRKVNNSKFTLFPFVPSFQSPCIFLPSFSLSLFLFLVRPFRVCLHSFQFLKCSQFSSRKGRAVSRECIYLFTSCLLS